MTVAQSRGRKPTDQIGRRQRPGLLLVNGIALGTVGAVQFVLDFLGYLFGVGPMGHALHGNPDTIGYAEAHGLAVILAIVLIARHRDGYLGWHRLAMSVHVLLGMCNLLFWETFVSVDVVPMGVGATLMHVLFATCHLIVLTRRAPEGVRSGPAA